MKRLLFVLPLALCACPANSRGQGSCDTQALDALGEQAARMRPKVSAKRVWPALLEACGDALPSMAVHAYNPDSPKLRRERDKVGRPIGGNPNALLIRSVCPEWDELQAAMPELPTEQRALATYRACKFARFELLDEDELRGVSRSMITSWAMYAWLREQQGLSPVAARPIARGLVALEQRNETRWAGVEGIELPGARGVPGWPAGSALSVGEDGPQLDGSAALDTTALASALAQAAAGEEDPLLLVGASEALEHGALHELLAVGQRAGFQRFALLVRDVSGLGYGHIPFALEPEAGAPCPDWRTQLDELEAEQREPEPCLHVELSAAGMHISSSGSSEPIKLELDEAGLTALTQYIRSFLDSHPAATQAHFSAAPEVPLRQLVAALESARGLLRVVVGLS